MQTKQNDGKSKNRIAQIFDRVLSRQQLEMTNTKIVSPRSSRGVQEWNSAELTLWIPASAGMTDSPMECVMLSMMKSNDSIIEKICALLDESIEETPSLTALGREVGLSPTHLQKIFKQAMGQSPKQYAKSKQLARLKSQLTQGRDVTTALYEAGFSSPSRLYESASAYLGMTPALYKKGGAGVEIQYAIETCELGCVLVAQTTKGVCAVRIGDSKEALIQDLSREFFAAKLTESPEALKERLSTTIALTRGDSPSVRLPLDIVATAFQQKVWEALQQIPVGETRSYRQIAAQLGQPDAYRAVGNACGQNPVALLIPCHRAVREDQSMGGYRWGLDRKKKLLQTEKQKK
jgi:AraC family transcriptional regulator of adaptative response/methylated-DNA-[protein]-cysteine methyltransferase